MSGVAFRVPRSDEKGACPGAMMRKTGSIERRVLHVITVSDFALLSEGGGSLSCEEARRVRFLWMGYIVTQSAHYQTTTTPVAIRRKLKSRARSAKVILPPVAEGVVLRWRKERYGEGSPQKPRRVSAREDARTTAVIIPSRLYSPGALNSILKRHLLPSRARESSTDGPRLGRPRNLTSPRTAAETQSCSLVSPVDIPRERSKVKTGDEFQRAFSPVAADQRRPGHDLYHVSLASSGDKDPSDTLDSTTDESEDPPPRASAISDQLRPGLQRRKKVKGYCISSEDDHSGDSDCRSAAARRKELREAQLDSDFDRVIVKLAHEWYYEGASRGLTSLLYSVDTSVFGFSSGDLLVDNFAKRALIISSVAAAKGLFVDIWFIFAYSGADARNFQSLALDYDSYFFSLSSLLPLVALFVSVLALVAFLGAIAWAAWPAAVFVMCVLSGPLVSLQFIVYECHRIALGLAWIVRGAWLGVLYVSRRTREVSARGADAQGKVRATVAPTA
ncbi:hypothetical protein V8E53_006223 [Lactarius tabidus]